MARTEDRTPPPRSPAPQHDPVFIWPTPNRADYLFWIEKNAILPKSGVETFAYGDPHPDANRFPDHKLVYVSPQTSDKWSKWFYASDRINQDAYNWEAQDAGLSGAKFLQVKRTLLTLRTAYDPISPAMGSAMANIPEGKFTGSFVLADRQQGKTPESELDSLYVIEERTYIQKEILTDIEPDPQSGIANQVTTTLFYRGEVVTGGLTIEALVAAPTNGYWSTDALGFGRSGKQLTDNWFSVSYGKIVDLDTIYEKSSDRRRPSKFYCPQLTTSATVITANNTPGVPDDPGASSGTAITIGKVGRIQKVTTVTQGGNPQVLKSLDLLSDDGKTYPRSEELVTLASVPTTPSGVDSDGKVIEYSAIDGCDASKVTRQAVSLENAFVKGVSRLKPEKFILDAANTVTTVTTTGVTSEPDTPTPEDQKRIKVEQKGRIRTLETLVQSGTLTALRGTDMDSDGYHYPVTQEVVDMAIVPITRTILGTDGRVSTFTPYDANYAIKETKQAVSIEPENRRRTSKLPPDRFYRDNQVASIEQVSTGVITPIVMPAVALGSDVDITQKGAIRTTRTITPPGPLSANKGSSLDERTGETFIESIEVVPIESVAPTFVSADGTLISFQPLDANWSIKRTSRVASTLTKSWTEITNYEWPAVLTNLTLKVFDAKNGRGSVIYVSDRYKQGFNGPQQMQVSQYWQKDEPTVILPVNLVAEGFDYQSPLFNIRVPPCLHGGYIMRCLIGSSDPDWEAALDVEYFPPTTYTDWPAQIFWRESQPRFGGFLVTEYTINRPTP